jgi:pyruvate dehydrogenase E2 component (dihydrolipoamide acetyltransferase)
VATEVFMPALGMAQETGKLLRWLKAEGQVVVRGEPLMEVETDKVTVEIEAPADGVLAGVCAAEGEDVPVGQTVAFVLAEGETLAETAAPAAPGPAPSAAILAPGPVAAETNGAAGHSRATVLASPKARRIARERGIAIEDVTGSGPFGAVQAVDVLAVDTVGLEGSGPAEAASAPELAVSSAWLTMAARMQQSWRDVPHFFLQRDVDATRLNSWRDALRKRAGYERVTHTDLLVKVCAAALAEHPRVNATWRDGTVRGQADVNVGIAVATDDALIVPVIHRADRIELKQVAERRAELVDRARTRKLRPDDVAGGTFTISNLGMFGVDAFLAIVPAPQAAILAVGRILERIVPVDGSPAVRPTLTLTLSFDHRVVDGAAGARFLDTLAALVEEPASLVS